MHVIPFDDHLAEGGSQIDLELCAAETRQAFLGLAATVTDTVSAAHVAYRR